MYVIVSGGGRVVVNDNAQPGKEIAQRRMGDMVSEVCIISGEMRVASVITVGDVRILCLDRLIFESTM